MKKFIHYSKGFIMAKISFLGGVKFISKILLRGKIAIIKPLSGLILERHCVRLPHAISGENKPCLLYNNECFHCKQR